MHGMGIRSNSKKIIANNKNRIVWMASDEGYHRSMPLFQGNLTTRFMHTVPSQHSKDLTLQQYRVYGILQRTTNVYGRPTSFVFYLWLKIAIFDYRLAGDGKILHTTLTIGCVSRVAAGYR